MGALLQVANLFKVSFQVCLPLIIRHATTITLDQIVSIYFNILKFYQLLLYPEILICVLLHE